MNHTMIEARAWISDLARLIHDQVDGTVILLGSLANREYVPGYSDIDLEWVFPDRPSPDVLNLLRTSVAKVVDNQPYVLNLRPIRSYEFPRSYPPIGSYDFVRRFALKEGEVLAGGPEVLDQITLATHVRRAERLISVDRLDYYLRRLRRLAINPTAITTVTTESVRLLLQQATAYTLHACRYANATLCGTVACPLAETARLAVTLPLPASFAEHVEAAVRVRSAWTLTVNSTDLDGARGYLLNAISAVETVRGAVPAHLDAPPIELDYRTTRS
ncbi:hypothetical protein GCM10012275_56060 [Longimycelium tulufanense]|uniref:Uncharacterized protein n=1 Tax=Longimycelium tulufanense TaxID=907463 RepID=A0A8J3FYR9_9PSEU|nr:hypothetical protein [Longimycelium tulufanense]GGM78194.1 hypothetical protein GCM10012275_56060 [Longimycelium tulufanense]